MRVRVAIALALAPMAARAEEGVNAHKVTAALRTPAPPVIDGRLDDEIWARTPADDRFLQAFPNEGQAPTERTEVRVLYDDSALYVGVRCQDSAPDQIVARMTRRDRDIPTDVVAIAIDSQQDRRTAFAFQLSAAGVQLDAMFFDDQNMNIDWDAVWDGEASRDATGWSAEFRIPLSVLRFPAGGSQDWGFQVVRSITRKKERVLWAFRPSTAQGEVSWFGRLSGLEGLPRARLLEVRPFVVGRLSGRTTSGRSLFSRGTATEGKLAFEPDLGVDAKLGVTSNLVVDATVNPDFGQVEADQVELNLSRFESFFPEKRPFFLEGADVYGTPLQLFYSRRIGQPPNRLGRGDSVRLDGGELEIAAAPASLRIWSAGKLTGAVTRNLSVGVLGAVTAAEAVDLDDPMAPGRSAELAPERSFAVARARYAIGARSYLGLMGTAVNRLGGHLYLAEPDHDAYTQGLDGYWQSPGGAYRLTGQAVLSERIGGPSHKTEDGRACAPGIDADCREIVRLDGTPLPPGALGFGGAVQFQARDGHLFTNGRGQTLSPRLDVNDAGFLPQFNSNSVRLVSGYLETKPRGPFQSFGIFGFGFANLTYEGVRESAFVGLDLEAEFRNFINTSPELAFLLPGSWDVVETGDGARLERGVGFNPSWWVATDSRKAVRVAGAVFGYVPFRGGGRFVGSQIEATYQASSRLQLELSPRFGYDLDSLRLYSCADPVGGDCLAATDDRLYHFARLDSAFLSLTTRGTYTFSPRLTLQWYAQLFFARGAYHDFTDIRTSGRHPDIRRRALVPSAFNGDGDGDGAIDNDFQSTNLNVNTVLRWEFRPGSALYTVYTRSQSADIALAGRTPSFSLRGLDTGPTEDIFLVKLSYFLR
jgi:hypothetical protein